MSDIFGKISQIAEQFSIAGTCIEASIVKSGHINSTYKAVFRQQTGAQRAYLIQKINSRVFPDPDRLMHNIALVTAHLREKILREGGDANRETLTFLQAQDGKYYFRDENGENWRICYFIDDTYSCDYVKNSKIFLNSGASFGIFQRRLADLPGSALYETIPDFHDTEKRFAALQAAIDENRAGRIDTCRNEITFALARQQDCGVLVSMIRQRKLPLRVTHNDTKLNNILFDNKTNQGICIVDLDTVMPGLALYDFGDSIRFGANTAAEDEPDITKVSLNIDLYQAYTEGYLSTAGQSLTETEAALLPFSSKLMTYECGIRFLTDYLNGDAYFKTAYAEHNLVRCRAQLALVADMERKLDIMQKINEKAFIACKGER
ncbi:MAG: aminoglycoside phosphotransferase family protein [Clostridia bacterium]|nr:aminoglycoside phosphotransferase family protein [Clostridia bacterium]